MKAVIDNNICLNSQFVTVNQHRLHYLTCGEGKPIVFLHGFPTHSGLWRNIMPALTTQGHCIALDLIGCGQSDKPSIDYSLDDHLDYFTSFIDALDLNDITLVMHAWGSVIGFRYAQLHPDKIRAMAFYEAHIRPIESRAQLALPVQELMAMLADDASAEEKVLHTDYYFNQVFLSGVLGNLSPEILESYKSPYATPDSRKPLWQFLQEVPLGETPQKTIELISQYSAFLKQSEHPKLMFYAVPGFTTTIDTVLWAKSNLPHLKLVDLGDALHYAQETKPDVMAEALSHWLTELNH